MRSNRFAARVESCSRRDNCAFLRLGIGRLGKGRLVAGLWEGLRAGESVVVTIRPEDVLLCAEHPGRISARNVLAGHVRALRTTPHGVYVTVDAGFPVVALLTRGAVRDLALRKGSACYAVIKATAIEPELVAKARWRASLVGPHGVVSHGQLDFLRLIDRTGSLTAAAREAGISYRTSWLRVREANGCWGVPLVSNSRGAGGGAVLTPEGRAALRLAARLERIT